MNPRNRRSVLKLLGFGAGAAGANLASGLERDGASSYAVVQGDRCVHVTPIEGTAPVEEFYDWAPTVEKQWSSNGTTGFQREETSIAFFYDGPAATSLVFVHDELGDDSSGGAVSFAIDGLPADGEWVVEDDDYDGESNYDDWEHAESVSHVDWTWETSRTDGGVFRGVTTDDRIRIVPRFNEAATLHGRPNEGRIERWEFLSGGSDDPKRVELAMDQPLTVGGVDCSGAGAGDARR